MNGARVSFLKIPEAASVWEGVPGRSVVAASEPATCEPGLGSAKVEVRGGAAGSKAVGSEAMGASANSDCRGVVASCWVVMAGEGIPCWP